MPVPMSPEDRPIAGVRVLVVDDDPHTREAVASVLEHFGATVTAVGSGLAGLQAIQLNPPDVLLADVLMPGMDGCALIRRVRALPPQRGGRTPAAALTAHAGVEERARILQAGFEYHLAKPVDIDRLLSVVAILAAKE
ncbi:MAG: response regulator [Candidatus Rokuibacteriota bacterium]